MPLNPAEQTFFNEPAKMPLGKPLSELSLEEFRASCDAFKAHTGPAADTPHIDFKVPVRDGSSIRTRNYNHNIGKAPLLVFYPGCGYVIDLFEVNAIACSRIAKHSAQACR